MPPSVVIGGGRKVYDGRTQDLFASFQPHKKLHCSLEQETNFAAPMGAWLWK